MLANDVMLDAFERVHELVPALLEGLSREDVLWQPDPESNSIGWLVWHLTRVEDDHVCGLVGREQAWPKGWRVRFALPYADMAHGYGMTAADVRAFDLSSPQLLVDYSAEVAAQTREIVSGLTEEDYARVVDTSWNPPVTLAIRLVSFMNDMTQHIGQAAYLRGLRERAISSDSGWVGHV
jgi:uncharacterized damage-inducible protein DinB